MLRVSRTGCSFSYLLGERREVAQQALTIHIEFPRAGCRLPILFFDPDIPVFASQFPRIWLPAGKYRPPYCRSAGFSGALGMRRSAAAPTVDDSIYRVPASGVKAFDLDPYYKASMLAFGGWGCHRARRKVAHSVYYIEILPGSGILPITPRLQLETTYPAPISCVTFRWLEYIEFGPASDISELVQSQSQNSPSRKSDFVGNSIFALPPSGVSTRVISQLPASTIALNSKFVFSASAERLSRTRTCSGE
ncbi:hypothetical protein R3P38DRAFT_3346691 [Favolaschia claudopus]|uniref:Uncharacterized protein n=1 Tax=Favolaschia claudopus TaxID=2862362 RepID=A0AAW0DAA9_9AGAR